LAAAETSILAVQVCSRSITSPSGAMRSGESLIPREARLHRPDPKEAEPADLPFQQSVKLEMVVNAKMAVCSWQSMECQKDGAEHSAS
jgi:hypothetical protein